MKEIESITFFYPSRIVGGAELLFIRLASLLSLKYKIYYIDYHNGFAKTTICSSETGIEFIEFIEYKKILLPEDTILITPLSSIIDIITFVNPHSTARILFWSIHPHGLQNIIDGFRSNLIIKWFLNKTESFGTALNFFIRKKSLVFMDGPNLLIQSLYFRYDSDNVIFLPIPCKEPEYKDRVRKENRKNVNIGWLGRLSDDKISSLLNVLEHASEFARGTNQVVDFHIIGDGSEKSSIREENYNRKLNITYINTLSGTALTKYLINNVDILFAMGTSALEGAALHIPTILVDFSYSPIPITNKFRWIYESKNYSLGDTYIDENCYNHSFEDILTEVSLDSSCHYSNLCYEYFKKNHDLEVISGKLVDLLSNVELLISDLNKTRFGIFNKIGFMRRKRNYFKSL